MHWIVSIGEWSRAFARAFRATRFGLPSKALKSERSKNGPSEPRAASFERHWASTCASTIRSFCAPHQRRPRCDEPGWPAHQGIDELCSLLSRLRPDEQTTRLRPVSRSRSSPAEKKRLSGTSAARSSSLTTLPLVLATISLSAFSFGCGGAAIPDPHDAAKAYAAAAARGDADALYNMLSQKGQRSLTRAEVRRIVREEKGELALQGKAVTGPTAVVKSEARLRYADGEEAALAVEDDGYRIAAADALPSAARTPVQVLGQLRRVLARRSYAGLIRVLSPSTRAAMENDIRSLVEGLENPEGLDVQVTGDSAIVVIPGGHEVRLRRENGTWHVEDFD
jgi:hypothetical protein